MLKGRAPPPEVTTQTERRIKGIKTRRTRGKLQRTVWRGIPVTNPARTLVDLAAVVDAETLARAAHEAGIKHHTTPGQVEAVLEQRRNSPGAAQLRAVLSGETRVTLSKLERAFLELLRQAGLPLPQTNRPAGTKRVDCRWPSTSSQSSSTATATTAPAMPGNKTAAENARPTPAATNSGATPTKTS